MAPENGRFHWKNHSTVKKTTNINVVMASPTQNPENSFPAWRLPNGTMNATDDQLERASSSCERWALGFGAAVVVAVIVEFIIAGIHPPYDSKLNALGSLLADAVIALGIVGEVLFSRKDGRIQTELRKRSNDKLAKAELELAKIKAPRVLTGEQIEALFQALCRFSGQMYDLSLPRMLEPSSHLNTQLIGTLRKAGWTLQSVQRGARREITLPEAIFTQEIPPASGKIEIPPIEIGVSDGWIGIHAAFENGDSLDAHAAFIGAMRSIGMEAHLVSLSPFGNVPVAPKTTPTTVHIIIGNKN